MKVGCLPIRTVADESWLFLYIHSNERLSEKHTHTHKNPETKTKQMKVTSYICQAAVRGVWPSLTSKMA